MNKTVLLVIGILMAGFVLAGNISENASTIFEVNDTFEEDYNFTNSTDVIEGDLEIEATSNFSNSTEIFENVSGVEANVSNVSYKRTLDYYELLNGTSEAEEEKSIKVESAYSLLDGVVINRTANSDTYEMPDGSLKTKVYVRQVNMKNEEGEFRPYEEVTSFVETEDSLLLEWNGKKVELKFKGVSKKERTGLSRVMNIFGPVKLDVKEDLNMETKIESRFAGYYFDHKMEADDLKEFYYDVDTSGVDCYFEDYKLICDEQVIDFSQAVEEQGLEVDGDEDRVGIMGEDLSWIDPEINLGIAEGDKMYSYCWRNRDSEWDKYDSRYDLYKIGSRRTSSGNTLSTYCHGLAMFDVTNLSSDIFEWGINSIDLYLEERNVSCYYEYDEVSTGSEIEFVVMDIGANEQWVIEDEDEEQSEIQYMYNKIQNSQDILFEKDFVLNHSFYGSHSFRIDNASALVESRMFDNIDGSPTGYIGIGLIGEKINRVNIQRYIYLENLALIISHNPPDTVPPETIAVAEQTPYGAEYLFGNVSEYNVNVTLSCTDNRSECTADSPRYCVDKTNTCTPDTVGTSVVIEDDGINYVRYQSTDSEWNVEDVKSQTVIMSKDYSELQLGVNGSLVWNESKAFFDQESVDITDELNEYLESCVADSEGYCDIPLGLYSKVNRAINLTDVEVNYNVSYYDWNISELGDGDNYMLKILGLGDVVNITERYSAFIINRSYVPHPLILISYLGDNLSVARNEFFKVDLNVSCLEDYCGSVNISLDPHPIEESQNDSSIKKAVAGSNEIAWEDNCKVKCVGGRCNTVLGKTVWVNDSDNKCKSVENAKSLKNSDIRINIEKDYDTDPDIFIEDYNATNVIIGKITSSDKKLSFAKYTHDISPSFVDGLYDLNKSKVGKSRGKLNSMGILDSNKKHDYEFNERGYDLTYGEELHFGETSTTLQLEDGNRDIFADTLIFDMTHFYLGAQIKWNISSLPEDTKIEDASLCFYIDVIDGSPDDDVTFYRINDQLWDESTSASEIFSQLLTNGTSTSYLYPLSLNGWACLNVTDILNYEYSLENANFSVRIEDPDYPPYDNFWVQDDSGLVIGGHLAHNLIGVTDREDSTSSGMLPYLNITYCSENILNTTITPWLNGSCSPNNTILQTRSFIEYDANDCGEWTNVTHWEYNEISCNYSLSSKYGLVSTEIGDTPFYTNKSNPETVVLRQGQNYMTTFWVNATGTPNINHEFFAFVDMDLNPDITSMTNKWNVVIE